MAASSQTPQSAEWELAAEGDVHQSLFAVAELVRQSQAWSVAADQLHESMFAGARASAYADVFDSDTMLDYEPSKIARNVTRQAVTTYCAKIFKHRPLPEILAHKGNWRDQRRARKMTQLIEGEFDRDKIFKKWARIIGRDSAINGRGILKIDLDSSTSKVPRAERVLPKEMFVDSADAKYGDPRNLYHIRTIDVGVAVRRFAPEASDDDPGHEDSILAEKIRASGRDTTDWATGDTYVNATTTTNRVRIVEAWHLCDDEDAHREDTAHECTGRHVISVRNADLVDEPWEFPRFPIEVLNYEEPLEGIFGTGICEQLEGYQAEQSRMSEKISNGHHTVGGGYIFVPAGSDVVVKDFDNDTNWKIVEGNGAMPPTFHTPDAVSAQAYGYLRDIGPDALAEVGLSQMSVESKKPAGISSGVALNTMDDIETERFGMQGYAYAQWCVGVAELYVMWIRHIAKKHGDYTSRVPLKGGILELSWKDVCVDNYVVQAHPGALLRLAPAARRQMAQELFNAGRIDGPTFLRYIGSGEADIDAEIDTETADRLQTDEMIEAMLDAEDPNDPDAQWDPSPYSTDVVSGWAQRRGQLMIAKATTAGAPEANLQLVRNFVIACDRLKAKALGEPDGAEAYVDPAAPPPVPTGPMGGPPPMVGTGDPMAAPLGPEGAPPMGPPPLPPMGPM